MQYLSADFPQNEANHRNNLAFVAVSLQSQSTECCDLSTFAMPSKALIIAIKLVLPHGHQIMGGKTR
jgi:hypothetical protein